MQNRGLKIRLGKGELWAIAAALSYALTNVTLKWALADAPPLFGAALKTIPVWIISIYFIINTGEYRKLNPKSIGFIGFNTIILTSISGIIVYVVGNWALFEALKRGAVTITSPITGTQVIWATLISYFFLKEKINLPMIVGMLVSIIGVMTLTIGSSGGNLMLDGWKVAVPLATLSALCYAIGGSIKRYLFTKKSLNRWLLIFLDVAAGEVVLHSIFLLQNNNYYTAIPIVTISKFLFAGLFGASAIICMTTATSLTEIASVTAINSTNTALSPIIAMIILGEKMNPAMFLGILLILTGVIVVQLKKPITSNLVTNLNTEGS